VVDGLAAAAVQGAPVEISRTELLLADDDDVLAVLGPRLARASMRVWVPEHERFVLQVHDGTEALRLQDPSRWLSPVGDEFRISLCDPQRLREPLVVPFGEVRLPVTGLWELQIEDAEVAEVLRRTCETLAAGRAGLSG